MFKWHHLVDHIKSIGYEGSTTDISAVKSFLSANGQSAEEVEIGDGNVVSIDNLYASREGKPLDASKAFDNAKRRAEIEEEVKRSLEAFGDVTGINKKDSGNTINKAHDIKIGKDRVIDDPKGGFTHAGEFYKGVVDAGTRDRIAPEALVRWQKASLSTYAQEGVGADGGFSVPQEFRDNITKLVQSSESLMSRCDQLPISRAGISLPDDETTPWGTSGIRSYWEGEADTIAQTKPVLKSKDFKLRKLTTIVPSTEELLDDSVALGAYIDGTAPERIQWDADEAIVRGSGSGKPLGFLTSDALVTVAKVTSQVADTISGENIISMFPRLYSRYRADSVWLCSHDAEQEILKLSVAGQTAVGGASTGYGFPLYSPPGMSRDGSSYGMLMGRPVLVTEHAAALGDVGDIMLVSMSQYRCVMRTGGIQAAQSMHLWFDQDAVAFKFRLRMDGAPKLSTTITPRSGTNSMSAFVTLAERG